MTTARSVTHFRKYQTRDEPSWAPVIFCGSLIAFNLGMYGYLIHALWMLAR